MKILLLVLLFFILFSLCISCLYAFPLAPIFCCCQHRPWKLYFLFGYLLDCFLSIMPNGYKSNDLPGHAFINDLIAHLRFCLVDHPGRFSFAISLLVSLQPVMMLVLSHSLLCSDLWIFMNLYSLLSWKGKIFFSWYPCSLKQEEIASGRKGARQIALGELSPLSEWYFPLSLLKCLGDFQAHNSLL